MNSYVLATFRALTDALLPSISPGWYGSHYLASDLNVHEYVIYSLNHLITIHESFNMTPVSLAYPTAQLLDSGASQLLVAGLVQADTPEKVHAEGGAFSRLSRLDRVRVLAALEELDVDVQALPPPYTGNGGLVKYVVDSLNQFSLFGYYSEWSGYGSTRLLPPDQRRLEFFPLSWQKVGYPGVSLGHRDFRGFLLKMVRKEDGTDEKS